MLISRVSEGEGEGAGPGAPEYRSADELFEMMARDRGYDTSDNQTLSTSDLIILYKNIDVGTKLMSSANVEQHRAPNQHVETVVYKDDRESDDSDVSENYSNEDLHDVFSINNERIDLINNISSVQHPLCQKLGDIEFQSSNFAEYDSHFLFKDPYIKQQLKNINILPDAKEFDTILPATLLDYICCKRLDDNYNFYMDNIIRYVQHTIEQLKRISNGDYLTDRAKEKWRQVAKELVIPSSDACKVLATSVSIPIHVMGKADGHRSTWDDIVHSEVDVRTLSKILEKKIIIEVPKLISGSYSLFSERCADNLIISCKKDPNQNVEQERAGSRLDVVIQLKPSASGHVIKNINSIMILQTMPSITTPDSTVDRHADIEFGNNNESFHEHPKIVEIYAPDDEEKVLPAEEHSDNKRDTSDVAIKKSLSDIDCTSPNNNNDSSSKPNIIEKGLPNRKVCAKTLKTETDFSIISPDELRCAIRRLNMQTPVPEESEESCVCKKKSPTRVRIKSPYENQSYTIEEKKRKKLLEIREKREKKKMALSENCKVSKHKSGKSAVMAQSSNSVTRLSITNKSFYNSIYGENANQEDGSLKKSRKSSKKDALGQNPTNYECENDLYNHSFIALDRSSFDDGNTETIIQLQQNTDTEANLSPTSAHTNDSTDVNLLSQLIASASTDCNSDFGSSPVLKIKRYSHIDKDYIKEDSGLHINDPINVDTSSSILVPANSPKDLPCKPQDDIKKIATPVECRKSIDKIYDLLKKIGKHDDDENVNNTEDLNIDGRRSSTVQVSDSGTSVKHHAVSSNPSTFSFEKPNNLNVHVYKDKKKKEVPATVVPKVIISTKLQTSKVETEWTKTDRKRVITSPINKVPDNPLKAISQLLHEFNNVQKTRHKSSKKDNYGLVDGKTVSRQSSSKKPRQEPPNKEIGLSPLKLSPNKDRRYRSGLPPDPAQFSPQLMYVDDKHAKLSRRNFSDIIDEAKEARGEAVRGPPKSYSRINALAQPKKSYVQAHNEEYQYKFGRNISSQRLNRVTTSAPLVEKTVMTNMSSARNIRRGREISSPKPVIPAVPPLENNTRPRRSASNSPIRKRMPPQPTNDPSLRQTVTPKNPDLKKKMVAVESYVKSHYGHMPIDTSELKGHEVHKSRVPLIPNDIDMASLSSPNAEESTALGNQLHYMVDTMINTNIPTLSVLTECQESKLSDGLEKLSTESLLKLDERKSESDYPVDIFEDKSILTAVSSIPKDKQENKVTEENLGTVECFDVQPFNSATELRKLENALYQRMSVGAFPKRLRIKNLTLTPKQSSQQVVVVESGDAGSLLVKSSLSQSLRSDSKPDSLTLLKPLDALSNSNIHWGFSNIPMQVATIGYAFPKYDSAQKNTLACCVKALMEKTSYEDGNKDVCKSHKTSQCFKGVHTEPCFEQAIQANILVSVTSTCKVNTSAEKKKNLTRKLNTTENSTKVQPITTICEKIRLISEKYETPQLITEGTQETTPKKLSCDNVQEITQQCELMQPIPQSEILQPLEQLQEECKDLPVSKTSTSKEINESEADRKPSKIIDQSTSLDILMGLLNEIRKITGETINNNIENVDSDNEDDNQCKGLEIILNNAATHESSVDNNCRDLVSVSSVDKLNRLETYPSISSVNLFKEGDETVNYQNEDPNEMLKVSLGVPYNSINVDKEVTVDVERQYVNQLTDVPSCFLPFTINNSTSISDSVVEILSEPSTLSVYSFAKFESLEYNNNIVCKAIEAPKAENVLSTASEVAEEEYLDIFNNQQSKVCSESAIVKEAMTDVGSRCTRTNKISRKRSGCVTVGTNLDPLLKVKRDILVTVYSILVFTVFAALSIPKLFFLEM